MGFSSDFLKSEIGRSLLPILSDAGFEEGGFLPLYTFNPNATTYISTTSTTWDGDADLSEFRVLWNDLFPADAEAQVFGQARVNPGAGETVDVRIQNYTDAEVIASETGITSDRMVTLGPLSYTPTTVSDILRVWWQWKVSPGTNSSNVMNAYVALGVKL